MSRRLYERFLLVSVWLFSILRPGPLESMASAATESTQTLGADASVTNPAPGLASSSKAGETVQAAFRKLAEAPNYRWGISAFELVFVLSPTSMQLRNYEGKVSKDGLFEARGTITFPTRRRGDPPPLQPGWPPFQAYEFIRNGESGFYRSTWPGPVSPWFLLGFGIPTAPEKDAVLKEFGELAKKSQSPVNVLRPIIDEAKFVAVSTDLYHAYVPEAELRAFLLGQKIELLTPNPMSGSIMVWTREGFPVKIDLFIGGGVDLVGSRSSFHQTVNLSDFGNAAIEIPPFPRAASF